MHSTVQDKVVSGTRFWGKNESDWDRLMGLIACAVEYSRAIIIMINSEKDEVGAASRLKSKNWKIPVIVEEVIPWEGVTKALNQMATIAASLTSGKDVENKGNPSYALPLLLIQSVEIRIEETTVDTMISEMHANPGTLVVGHKLPGHTSYDDLKRRKQIVDVPLTGCTIPWNTLALWNVTRLCRTYFPSIADAVDPPGMEEVGILALQHVQFGPKDARAILLRSAAEAVEWQCNFDDVRLQAHHQKMRSKSVRAQEILKWMDISPATIMVTHVYH